MDEIYSFDILYKDADILEELYELVRQNLPVQLNSRLNELSNSIEYLTTLTCYNEGQLSLLMIAALNGYDEIIRILFTHCNPIHQIELKGRINLSNEVTIHGVTALYCACYHGNFTIAKTLIEIGNANVKQETDDYPTYPLLLHAAMMNRIDIVHFLIENNYSDINKTKSTNYEQHTALICAAFNGYISLVSYLIEHGADVNPICEGIWGNFQTPLLCAIVGNHIEVAELLYEAGANLTFQNYINTSYLRNAIATQSFPMINFLLDRCIYTVEDLELAACSLVCTSSTIAKLHEILEVLEFCLQKRQSMGMSKVCIPPIAAYDYNQECQTIDELDSIRDNPNRILIEILLIQERIFLLRQDIGIIKPMHEYGDMLVHRREFDKCLDLWIHMFYLYQQIQINTILHRFVWIFCRMFTANQKIPVERFLQIGRLAFEPSQIRHASNNVLNVLFLVVIGGRILERKDITKDEQLSIYRWIQDVCRHQSADEEGNTLLHFCVNSETTAYISFRSSYIVRYLKFPNVTALRLLLTYGNHWLDLDATESNNGATPLHVICKTEENEEIIKLLVDFDCHIDCVDKYGDSPIDFIENENIRALLIPKPTPLNLKCLCARMIAHEQISTTSLKVLNKKLKQFIVLHGGSSYIPFDCK